METLKRYIYAVMALLLLIAVIFLVFVSDSFEEMDDLGATSINREIVGDARSIFPVAQEHIDDVFKLPEEHSIALDDVRAKLISGLNASGSYRPLYEESLRNPQAGGIFYATRIIARCMKVMESSIFGKQTQAPYSPEMDSSRYLEMSEAGDALREKCAAFTSEEISDRHGWSVISSGVAVEDPLISAMKALGSNYDFTDVEKLRLQVNEIIRLRDPFLIDEVRRRMALVREPETGKFGYQFSGKFYSVDSEVNVNHALYLLPCGLGMQCDKNEFDVAIKCAAAGECYSGREDYVRKMMTSDTDALEKTLALYEEMVEAVKSGDQTKFLN